MAEYKIVGVCYNKYETNLASKIKNAIDEWETEKTTEQKWYIADEENPDMENFKRIQGSVKEWTGERFADSDVIIYIAPVVRVVRYIGKLLEDQSSDPAVIAVDSNGRYCIPVLSGRRGEAYEIARVLDSKLDIKFINATAPEDATQFDIAKYAESNNLIISNSDYATEVSTAIHAGDEIGFYTSFPVVGSLPGGMEWKTEGDLGIYISPSYKSAFFAHTLWLIPRCINIAVKCHEQVNYRQAERFILDAMKEYSLYPEALLEVNMIRGSKSENELRRFAVDYGAEFNIISEDFAKNYVGIRTSEFAFDKVADKNMNCSITMRNVYVRF